MRELFWGLYDSWNVIKDMAWQISIVILLVCICRLFVGKVSKQASYLLWAIVAIRLLVPVMPESGLSVFNAARPELFRVNTSITGEMTTSEIPTQNNAGTILPNPSEDVTNMIGDLDSIYENTDTNTAADYAVDGAINVQQIQMSEQMSNAIDRNISSETSNFLRADWMFLVWGIGGVILAAYGVISYCHLKHKLRFATSNDHKVYEDGHISSPFVFGIVKPRIYLPYRLTEEERDYILRHENYHIKRKDYLVKILAFGLLAVYWFQPLVWVAYYLMSRDMEASCDEQVLKELGAEERKAYSTLLLGFACEKRIPLPSPVSFGENDIKSRIKSILNYKKPTFWSLVAMMALVAVLVAVCLTDAKSESNEDTQTKENDTQVEITNEEILNLAEELYHAKTPYIGDVSANGKILSILRDYYAITRTNGNELQTYEEPFWITIGFDEKPDDTAMWKLASVFLALVENASEFRWEFVAENDTLYTYYVQTADVEAVLGCEDLKEYAETPEQIAELLMFLDEKETGVTKPMDDVSYQINKHLSYSHFSHYADKAGIPWEIANQYELRLMEDGVIYRNDEYKAIYECIYKDFDNSGKMDFALYVRDLGYGESTLHIYMNDDPLYTHVLPMSCWSMEILAGDIDHDGNTELIYNAFNGGVGGAGGYVKGILKYVNHTFTEMELPGDFTEEEREYGESGYHIEVYFGKEHNTYEVVCPALGISEIIQSEYFKDIEGNYIVRPYAGHKAGANCRGFYNFHILIEDSQEYLMAEEYFFGEAGVNYGLGYMRFIFDWSDEEGWIVKETTIHPFAKGTSTEDDIFDLMKSALSIYPDNYEELTEYWNNIPVINYADGSIYDPNNRFTLFAQTASKSLSSDSLIYAKMNEAEELTYVYVNYRDDKYYYLEDYTRVSDKPYFVYEEDYSQKVYMHELYSATKYSDGSCFEHFYLTNEENLTKNDIFESLISSQYPPSLDFISVYTKELDEEGLDTYIKFTGDFINHGIKITMPQNYSWIDTPRYKLLDDVVCGTYSDFILDADMIIRAGEREAVFEKSRSGLAEKLAEWDYETWGARTLEGEYIEIKLYVEPLNATKFYTVVAEWEYEGNTYLLYGDTKESDGSPVAKTAIYIIEHFEKHE